ncbi:rhodanese-like domain-containing protein [Cohnella hongkongensis]|uniref:Rhodanese-like domain-containing protein n=1 Tax=Cohnella hongkongensis TaxID=178337 RepID=A0ABV9FHN1_9BACL
MDTGIFIAVVALLILFIYSRLKPVKGLNTLSADEFRTELGKDRMLIDVREPYEYKVGFIPGAKNFPLSQLQGRLKEIPTDRPILLYCRSGVRSKTAARLLLKNGYTDLTHLQGGMNSWNGKSARV